MGESVPMAEEGDRNKYLRDHIHKCNCPIIFFINSLPCHSLGI